MISYLFDQGMRAADLWSQEEVRRKFIERVRNEKGNELANALEDSSPSDLIIEFAIADYPNDDEYFTIPFLAKLSFEAKAREIESRGFSVRVSFIEIERPQIINA